MSISGGRAGGKARAAAMTPEERSIAASNAAPARWQGSNLASGRVASIARAMVIAWGHRANLDVTSSYQGDSVVDELLMPPDLSWVAPLQVRGIARDGLTVYRRYVGLPLLLAYVFLGAEMGGLVRRECTSIVVLPPGLAWNLPTQLGMARSEATDLSYRWPVVGQRLMDELEAYTARDPDTFATLLEDLTPLRAGGVSQSR
ncbi:MAG: hypothetical protein M1522_03670 [Actinobacteria bacterium]|nr:hypothetical protein [Actinomycetota bacterium]